MIAIRAERLRRAGTLTASAFTAGRDAEGTPLVRSLALYRADVAIAVPAAHLSSV